MKWRNALASSLVAACLLGTPAPTLGQSGGGGEIEPGNPRSNGTGFRFNFGWQDVGGDMGENLDQAIDAEFSFFFPVWKLRLGVGANWMSYGMDDIDETWSQIRFHFIAGYHFLPRARVRPYVEGRATWQRLRPEEDRFFGGEEEILGDFLMSGPGVEGVAGVEVPLGNRWAIDLSAALGTYSVSPNIQEYDPGLVSADSGTPWRIAAGITWYPLRHPAYGGGR
jgi:hypothetical protein